MLTPEQHAFYDEQGYVLVPGLVPGEIGTAAEKVMWELLQLSPDDPAAWPTGTQGHGAFASPELVACYTPGVVAAAAALAGDDPATLRPPSRGYCINIFPTAEEWRWPRPHIDHAIKEAGHTTFPRAFRIAAMTFLHDVAPHGGGTIVWPGSHRRIEALARSDPERYELMWSVNQALRDLDLGAPLEVTPRRGDVLFYHYLCAHAGSLNVSDRPRFAMNQKW
jgi:hypothetical protein